MLFRSPSANRSGQFLEAVTKDQLNTGLSGQIRFRVSERNLYAYLFGVKRPIVHVMGYFVSILRERIANFEAPRNSGAEIRVGGSDADAQANDIAPTTTAATVETNRRNPERGSTITRILRGRVEG